jgi:hypothetical protein
MGEKRKKLGNYFGPKLSANKCSLCLPKPMRKKNWGIS